MIDENLKTFMEKVEIKKVHPALFQLGLKDFLFLFQIFRAKAGELAGNIVFVTGISTEDLAHHQFGVLFVIAPCSVIIIDTLLHSIGYHFGSGFLIDIAILPVDGGQAHASQSQRRQLFILKTAVNHRESSFLLC